MKSFIRTITALIVAVCLTALPSALVLAAGSDAVSSYSSQEQEQSKVTPDSREIISMTANTGEWKQKADKKWYYYDDGKPCIGWRTINGHMYYFEPDKNGAMATGFRQIAIGGKKYTFYFSDANYLKYTSQMLSGFKSIDGALYYLADKRFPSLPTGVMATGFKTISGKTFFFADSRYNNGKNRGQIIKGFVFINNKAYYFDPKSGALQTDWASKHVIVIDPGHSADPADEDVPIGPGSKTLKEADNIGAESPYTGLMEYELNLQISLKLRDLLTKRGYKVVMVRTKNSGSYSCIDRAQIANKNNAAIFLRVHANAAPKDHSKNGAMTICITKNNPFTPGTYKQSRQLSDIMLAQYVKATGCYNEGVMETDTMMGNNWSEVPTTLIELGYMTNKKEDALMQTSAYQEKMLAGLVNGIDAYFKATVK